MQQSPHTIQSSTIKPTTTAERLPALDPRKRSIPSPQIRKNLTQPPPPSILNKEIEDDDQYFSRPVSSRWPKVARESIANSVPHFRGIKSWTMDQFERQIGKEKVPDMPHGGYVKM